MGAIIGDNNKQVEALKLAWEPARYVAWINWNVAVDKKSKIKDPQQLMRFPWEKKVVQKGEAKKVILEAVAFRNKVKEKWGLKYKE